MTFLEVRGAPTYYSCELGVLETLPSFLQQHGLIKPLILHGEKSWKEAKPYFPKLQATIFEKYQGECSPEEISRIAKITVNRDVIIGIGGGKIIDIAKAVGNERALPVILIPTLASTCAAWTPLSVIYNEIGQFLHYTIFPKSTLGVFVEPRILLSSPPSYLRAGIGDTLAKWYEADAVIRIEVNKTVPMQIAHSSALLCKENLLKNSLKAMKDLKNQVLSAELVSVFETNIVAGGVVGGFGDRYGRIAGAHSIHNALTQLTDTHHLLHGEKVAFGILIQLLLEDNDKEVISLLPLYKDLGLPFNLSSLGLQHNISEKINTIGHYAVLPEESIHLLGLNVTEKKIVKAIYDLETFSGK